MRISQKPVKDPALADLLLGTDQQGSLGVDQTVNFEVSAVQRLFKQNMGTPSIQFDSILDEQTTRITIDNIATTRGVLILAPDSPATVTISDPRIYDRNGNVTGDRDRGIVVTIVNAFVATPDATITVGNGGNTRDIPLAGRSSLRLVYLQGNLWVEL